MGFKNLKLINGRCLEKIKEGEWLYSVLSYSMVHFLCVKFVFLAYMLYLSIMRSHSKTLVEMVTRHNVTSLNVKNKACKGNSKLIGLQ